MAVGTIWRRALPYGNGAAFSYRWAFRNLPIIDADLVVSLINSSGADLEARIDPEDGRALIIDSDSLALIPARDALKQAVTIVSWSLQYQLRADDRRIHGPELSPGITLWRADDGSYCFTDEKGHRAARRIFRCMQHDAALSFAVGSGYQVIRVSDDREPDELAEQVRLAAESQFETTSPVTVPVTPQEYHVWRLDVSQTGKQALAVAMAFATGSYCDLTHWHYSDADRFVDVRVFGGHGPDEVCNMLAAALADILKRPVDVPVPKAESDVQPGPEQAACDDLAEALERLVKPMLEGEEVVIRISVKK
jgi:hypothetical protein